MFEYIVGLTVALFFYNQFALFHKQYKETHEKKKNPKESPKLSQDQYMRDDVEETALRYNADPGEFADKILPRMGVGLLADDLQYLGPSPDYDSPIGAAEQLRPLHGIHIHPHHAIKQRAQNNLF
jgi:hypothetical protein